MPTSVDRDKIEDTFSGNRIDEESSSVRPVIRGRNKRDIERPSDSVFGEVVQAAFEQENTVAALYNIATRPEFEVDETWRLPESGLDGYEEIEDELIESVSEDHFNWIRSKYDEEMNRRKLILDNWEIGIPASIVASVADPTILLTGAGLVKLATKIPRFFQMGKGIVGTGAIAATEEGIRETILHEDQLGRSIAESALNVGGGAIIGGVIGGVADKISRNKAELLSRKVEETLLDNLFDEVPTYSVKVEDGVIDFVEPIQYTMTTTPGVPGMEESVRAVDYDADIIQPFIDIPKWQRPDDIINNARDRFIKHYNSTHAAPLSEGQANKNFGEYLHKQIAQDQVKSKMMMKAMNLGAPTPSATGRGVINPEITLGVSQNGFTLHAYEKIADTTLYKVKNTASHRFRPSHQSVETEVRKLVGRIGNIEKIRRRKARVAGIPMTGQKKSLDNIFNYIRGRDVVDADNLTSSTANKIKGIYDEVYRAEKKYAARVLDESSRTQNVKPSVARRAKLNFEKDTKTSPIFYQAWDVGRASVRGNELKALLHEQIRKDYVDLQPGVNEESFYSDIVEKTYNKITNDNPINHYWSQLNTPIGLDNDKFDAYLIQNPYQAAIVFARRYASQSKLYDALHETEDGLTTTMARIDSWYDALLKGVPDENKMLKKSILRQKQVDKNLIHYTTDRILNRPSDRALDRSLSNVGSAWRQYTTMISLGQMTLSALSDSLRLVAAHNLMPLYRQAQRMIPGAGKVSNATNMRMGLLSERIRAERFQRMTYTEETFETSGSAFASVGRGASNVFQKATLMNTWNDTLKSVNASQMQHKIIKHGLSLSKGKNIPKRYKELYARLGLDDDDLKSFADLYKRFSGPYGSHLYHINSAKMDESISQIKIKNDEAIEKLQKEMEGLDLADDVGLDRRVEILGEVDAKLSIPDEEVFEKIASAINKHSNEIIITPNALNQPTILNREEWKFMMQFKSFLFGAHANYIAQAWQRKGVLLSPQGFSVALGTMVGLYFAEVSLNAKAKLGNYERPKDDTERLMEVLDQMGVFTSIFTPLKYGNDIFSYSGYSPRDELLAPALREMGFRYKPGRAFRNHPLQGFVGPGPNVAVRALDSSVKSIDNAINDKITDDDITRLKKLIPFQNIFWLNGIFQEMQEAMMNKAGVRYNAKKRHEIERKPSYDKLITNPSREIPRASRELFMDSLLDHPITAIDRPLGTNIRGGFRRARRALR